jgi:protein involved in ribonucleotide reduction
MSEQRAKNLAKALGVIRKGVTDFQDKYVRAEDEAAAKAAAEILDMVDRVIDIYA